MTWRHRATAAENRGSFVSNILFFGPALVLADHHQTFAIVYISSMNALDIEPYKENITPLPGGRSVKKLSPRPKNVLSLERAELESKLSAELDDPIQPYIEYIRWYHDNYPSDSDSGLLLILERCTAVFSGHLQYRNDARYLKVWLEYARYSDNQVDVFIYLAKKEIGCELALYYEEFSKVLIGLGRLSDARAVFETGIRRGARPLTRITRVFKNFEMAYPVGASSAEPSSNVMNVLTTLSSSGTFESISAPQTAPKRKISVFADVEEPKLATVFEKADPSAKLGGLNGGHKENIITSTSWSGKTMSSSQPEVKRPKIQVYRDVNVKPKRTERVEVNLNILYGEEEMCLGEMLMYMRTQNNEAPKQQIVPQKIPELVPETRELERVPSPTITFYSKIANQEVASMFNSVADLGDDTTNFRDTIRDDTTNFTFTTTKELGAKFVDPFLSSTQAALLADLKPSLDTYEGYHQFDSDQGSLANLKPHKSIILDKPITIKRELGKGGFGYVYLIEMEGDYKAMKVESISSSWEFYILNQVHRRLNLGTRVVKPECLHMFQDESYLILNYLNQGTLLDVVNSYKQTNEPVEEILCIFFTIELLKIVEELHRNDIIHGDLKADNCMIQFQDTFNITDQYNEEWGPQVVLIDFGRAIDLTLYPEGVEFMSNFKPDEQDCPQMNNNQSWTFEADYYGIAAILHTLLFGDYIKIQKLENGKYKLKNTLKRYWQLHLWQPLFNILLNPYYNCDEKIPLVDELKYQRGKFEHYLKENCRKLGLKRVVNSIERMCK